MKDEVPLCEMKDSVRPKASSTQVEDRPQANGPEFHSAASQ
jgi:hypothetical protein